MKSKNNVKIAIIISVVLIAATIGILYWFSKKDGTDTSENTSSNGTGSSASTYPLKLGSRGAEVEALQAKLNSWLRNAWPKLTQLKVDGIWGAKTEAIVKLAYADKNTLTKADIDNLVIPIAKTSTGATSSWT